MRRQTLSGKSKIGFDRYLFVSTNSDRYYISISINIDRYHELISYILFTYLKMRTLQFLPIMFLLFSSNITFSSTDVPSSSNNVTFSSSNAPPSSNNVPLCSYYFLSLSLSLSDSTLLWKMVNEKSTYFSYADFMNYLLINLWKIKS